MIRKIAIIGPESTGKSTLSAELAEAYHTTWVPEYARHYIDKLNRPYDEQDLLEIAKGQMAMEDELAAKTNKLLIIDTTLIVIKIWSEHAFGRTHPWIEKELTKRAYDLFLVCDVDLPWEPDPQREHPELRSYFFDKYLDYARQNPPFAIITGQKEERFQIAKRAIDNL